MPTNKKVNKLYVAVGLAICLVAVFLTKHTFTLQTIRYEGMFSNAKIVELRSSRGGPYAVVEINNDLYEAGSCELTFKVGDRLPVYYKCGNKNAVQERIDNKTFILWYSLQVIMFVLGGICVFGSISDKID